MGDEYEELDLRIMIQEELSPITQRTVPVDLAQSFCEIFKCMCSHLITLCDVSADVKSTSSKHRTGTKPFMAIDLIHPDLAVHMYRHDLESIFSVLVWITSRFDNRQEIADPPLQKWADNDDQVLVEKKRSFFLSMPPQ
jgi:hypothetical protein